MTSIAFTATRGVRMAVAMCGLLLAILLSLAVAGGASAHSGHAAGDPVGGTKAHAYADGVIGKGSTVRRWERAKRKRLAALRKRNRKLRSRGVKLLTDQQIRQGVLLQSLGIPVTMSSESIVGVASETGDIPLSREGKVLSGPTGYALSSGQGSPSANTVTPEERAVKGEWSMPVQPNYPTFGPNLAPATGFPNPNYPTGTFPGDPIIDTAADYSANPDGSGLVNARYWSPNPRIIPIFEAMLPNGKVLYWDWYFSGNMNDPNQAIDDKKGTRVLLWDPANPSAPGIRKDVPGENLFCAGFAQLPNGDLFLAGGNANADLEGLNTTFVYHWRDGTWSQSQDMSRIRWYPSVAATWNGEQMIIGGDPNNENGGFNQGGNAVPEVFTSNFTNPSTTQNWDPVNPADKIRVLGNLNNPYNDQNNPHVPGWRLYPFLFPWVDGNVLYGGRETDVLTVDQRKHGITEKDNNPATTYDPTGDTDETDDGGDRYVIQRADGQDSGGRQIVRTYGTGAQYGRGKVLVTAGDEDRVYTHDVPVANRGPGWDTYTTGDPKVDDPNPGANWVCLGYANGNPYSYSGNPFAANANYQWSGNAGLVHVWNLAWCAGTNTVIPGNPGRGWVNGASKEAALITMKDTEGETEWGGYPTSKGWPSSTQTQSMHYPRRMANLTVLPTGKLIATGGLGTTNAADEDVLASENYTDTPGIANNTKTQYAMIGNDANVNATLVNFNRAIFASEMWDPNTGTWTVMDSAHRPRQYHSTTILLPDARLMSGGGGVCSTCTTSLYSEANFEYYSPPYLFWPDGATKAAAERPQITGSNGAGLITEGVGANAAQVLSPVEYDDSFTVNFTRGKNQAGDADVAVQKAALVKLGDPTHGFDQGQLYVPLEISNIGSTSATLKAPPNPFEAPPGYYWLFLMDSNGTPSVAKAIQVGASLPLQNKLRTARAYAERDLEDPYPDDLSSSQDFGLGSYRATHGNLADVRDNSMSSIKIDSGFYAKICRGDDLTGCATVPAGEYKRLGTAFEDHVSSIEIKQGTAPQNDSATLTDLTPDTQGPTISINSPILPGGGAPYVTTASSISITYTVTDNVSEADSPEDTITCDQPSGHVFALTAGLNNLAINCTDGHGNSSNMPVPVQRNLENGAGPVITVTSPPESPDPFVTDDSQITLNFTATDDSGIVGSCNRASGSVIPLNYGANPITVECEDGAGNATTVTRNVKRRDLVPPSVAITSPADNSVVSATPVTVTFTATDNAPGPVGCSQPSGFQQPLTIGVNTISINCQDAQGNVAASTIHVAYVPPGGVPTDGDKSRFGAMIHKRMKFSKRLHFKVLCEQRCVMTIGIVGNGISYWPKGKPIGGSKRARIATFKIKSGDYRQISAALKRKSKLKLGVWINDKRQGTARLTR